MLLFYRLIGIGVVGDIDVMKKVDRSRNLTQSRLIPKDEEFIVYRV